jgi:hypothetical protein
MNEQGKENFPQLKEKYQVLPSMPPEQFAALKADIGERGVLTPIDIDEEGQILDGHHRYRACVELGVVDFPTIVRPGMSEEDRRMFARKANMLRRHLSREQVRQLVAEQLRDTPNWANSRVAQALGVDDKTVKVVRDTLESTSEIPKFDKLIGADGKTRPTKRPAAVMAHNVDELQKILARLAEGGAVEGFAIGAGGVIQLEYDPFEDCNEADFREWKLYMLFGAHPLHVHWILRMDFKNPAEWLGEEGAKFRQRYAMQGFPPAIIERWNAFCAKHKDTSLSELEALLQERLKQLNKYEEETEKAPKKTSSRATQLRRTAAA